MVRRPSANAFFADELTRLEAGFSAGHFPSLIEALLLCSGNALPVPEWVGEHAAAALTAAFNGTSLPGTQRGRTGGLEARVKTQHSDYLRWSRAKFWLDNRDLLPGLGFAATREGAFEMADEELRRAGSFAVGSPASIEQSFTRVAKAMKAGAAVSFFAAADDPLDVQPPKPPQKTRRIKPARAKTR